MDANLVNNQYSLSIRICSDGFSLSVYDDNKQIISSKHLKSTPGEDEIEFLKQSLVSHAEINSDYRLISFICESTFHSIIPEIFHTVDKEEDFLKLQHPTLPASFIVMHQKQVNLQAVLLFGIEQQKLELIYQHLPTASIISHLHPLITKMVGDEQSKLALWIREVELDCIVYKNNKIVLLNKYSYHTMEDVIFHILNIYQQLVINPSEFITEIYKDGDVLNEGQLKEFIPSIIIQSKQAVYEDYQWQI